LIWFSGLFLAEAGDEQGGSDEVESTLFEKAGSMILVEREGCIYAKDE